MGPIQEVFGVKRSSLPKKDKKKKRLNLLDVTWEKPVDGSWSVS